MHNQISEGVTELISRFVMNSVGDELVEKDRYIEKVDAVLKVFKKLGLSKAITYYFKKPDFLIAFHQSNALILVHV